MQVFFSSGINLLIAILGILGVKKKLDLSSVRICSPSPLHSLKSHQFLYSNYWKCLESKNRGLPKIFLIFNLTKKVTYGLRKLKNYEAQYSKKQAQLKEQHAKNYTWYKEEKTIKLNNFKSDIVKLLLFAYIIWDRFQVLV